MSVPIKELMDAFGLHPPNDWSVGEREGEKYSHNTSESSLHCGMHGLHIRTDGSRVLGFCGIWHGFPLTPQKPDLFLCDKFTFTHSVS